MHIHFVDHIHAQTQYNVCRRVGMHACTHAPAKQFLGNQAPKQGDINDSAIAGNINIKHIKFLGSGGCACVPKFPHVGVRSKTIAMVRAFSDDDQSQSSSEGLATLARVVCRTCSTKAQINKHTIILNLMIFARFREHVCDNHVSIATRSNRTHTHTHHNTHRHIAITNYDCHTHNEIHANTCNHKHEHNTRINV